MDLLQKIATAKLVGRGGAAFPVEKKWLYFKQSKGDKYIIANGAEGEPGVKKDGYIIKHHSAEVINGLKMAIEYFKAKQAFIFLNHNYSNLDLVLKKQINKLPIKVIYKPKNAGYIAGEESALIAALQDYRIEPSLKPPFPVSSGYKTSPTLVHNIETWFNTSLVAKEEYKNYRFYTVNKDKKSKVYYLPANWTMARILEETNNFPRYKFFVQHGGDASGEIINSTQLKQKVSGSGSITIIRLSEHVPLEFIKHLVKFYAKNSCGKCTPCREGTYRLEAMLNSTAMNWPHFLEIIDNLHDSSFCALGSSLYLPMHSYLKNVNPDFQPHL